MTDVEVYRQPAELAVASDIDSWTQVAGKVIKLAEEIYDTPFVPDGLRGSVPATAAAILAGRELGLGPMTSLANVHVIKGKPALSAALMRALILAQGHQIETVDISDTRVIVRGRRRGESTWEEASFTADQAKRAQIQLGGYPQDKLYARATTRLARRKFADVIAGMPYSAEELEDGDDPADGVSANGTNGSAPAAQPAQRTARRGRAPQNVPPAEPATPPQAPAAPQPPAGGTQLPPLPGEEEADPTPGPQQDTGSSPSASAAGEPDTTDYDTPGTVTKQQIGKLQTVYHAQLGYKTAERELTMEATEDIIKRGLLGPHKASDGSDRTHNNLSFNEAKTVIDTLEMCGTRERLTVLLRTGELPEGEPGDE